MAAQRPIRCAEQRVVREISQDRLKIVGEERLKVAPNNSLGAFGDVAYHFRPPLLLSFLCLQPPTQSTCQRLSTDVLYWVRMAQPDPERARRHLKSIEHVTCARVPEALIALLRRCTTQLAPRICIVGSCDCESQRMRDPNAAICFLPCRRIYDDAIGPPVRVGTIDHPNGQIAAGIQPINVHLQ
jgi:hypothetical protein